MKKMLLAALIAATALVPPAFAQDRGGRWGGDRSAGPSQRSPQARDWSRPAPAAPQQTRAQRQWDGGARGNWNRPAAPVQPQPQQFRSDGNRGDRGDRNRWNNGSQRQGVVGAQQFRGDRNDGGRFDRGDRTRFDRSNPGWNGNRGPNRNWNGGNVYRGDRGGRWDNGWRNDRRYDWRGYRTQNRSLYRLPRYYAPSGWGYGYRRFTPGFQLSALLYSSNYWINDPFSYRLPEVDGPYRWVRYYNDALLVDTYTGEVVDTIYDIFW